MRKAKRLLSLLLTLIMICGLLPVMETEASAASGKVISEKNVEDAISYAFKEMQNRPSYWAGYCAAFVWACYNKGAALNNSSYSNATRMGNSLISDTGTNPPRGAFVFWTSKNHNNGHVGLSLGDGTVIHAYPNITVTKISKVNSNSAYTYRGWGAPIAGYTFHEHTYNSIGVCTGCQEEYDFDSTFKPLNGSLQLIWDTTNLYSKPYDTYRISGISIKLRDTVKCLGICSNAKGDAYYRVSYTQSGTTKSTTGFIKGSQAQYIEGPNIITFNTSKSTAAVGNTQVYGEIKSSNLNLTKVKLGIYYSDGTPTQYVKEYDLSGKKAKTFDTSLADDYLLFSKLSAGSYYYKVEAWTESGSNSSDQTYSSARNDFTKSGGNVTQTNFTLKFDANGGGGAPAQQTVTKGQSLYFAGLGTPSWHNHIFLGWATSDYAESPEYTSSITPSNNLTLFAVWDEIQPPATPYMRTQKVDIGVGGSVSISWDGSTGAESYTVTAYRADGSEYKSFPAKSTSTYAAFDEAGSFTLKVKARNTAGDSAYSTSYATVTVHAPSTVTFKDYDGSIWSTQKVGYKEDAITPTSPSRTGYTFTGWTGNMSKVTEDRTLTAKYSHIPYYVTFLDYNGNVAAKETVYYSGDTPGSATPPDASELNIPSQWAFVGWDTNDYNNVTKQNVVVTPVTVWANEDVPIETNITNATKAGNGYWVNYKITNHSQSKNTQGRVVVVLKSQFGKFLTQSESGAFYLTSNGGIYNGTMYVPMPSELQSETVAIVEAYVVGSYSDLTPISEYAHYMIGSVDGDWSSWMTEAEYNEFIKTHSYSSVQTKTQYRTQTKLETYSTSSSLSGYTRDDSKNRSHKSDWSVWSAYQDTAVTANDNRKVEPKTVQATAGYTQYRYGRWQNSNGKNTYCRDSGYASGSSIVYTGWSTTRYKRVNTSDYTCGTNSPDHNHVGVAYVEGKKAYWYVYSADGTYSYSTRYFWEDSRYIEPTYKTQYRYQTRYDITDYYFYKWTDWSGWSETSATAGSNLRVETRTLYRVKLNTPADSGKYTVSGALGNVFAGEQAVLTVYKVDEASDYSNEYIAQTVLDANGGYSFCFDTLEEPSIATGDFTVTLTIEGSNAPLYIGTIEAPKPQFTVIFKDEVTGEQIGADQLVELGDSATAPQAPEHEGYTFIGWEYGLGNIREDMTIKARYVKNKYTVVYVDFARNYVDVRFDLSYGSALDLPTVEAPQGYTFMGWYSADGEGAASVTGNMILMAEYEQMSYNVVFLNADGTTLAEQVVLHGEFAAAPEDVSVDENQYFSDWPQEAYAPVEGELVLAPVIYFEEDAEMPTLSLSSGVYEGAQTLSMSNIGANTLVTYTVETEESGSEFEELEYSEPISLTKSATVTVTASEDGKNGVSEEYEFVIVPEESRKDAPPSVTATESNGAILLAWDAVDGATGYIIDKEDRYGTTERFLVSTNFYTDSNVFGVNDYIYKISTYVQVGEGYSAVYLTSIDEPAETTLRYYGDCKAVTDITILPASPTLYEGSVIELSTIAEPADAYDTAVNWLVEDGTGSASISENGILTAISAGTITVKALAKDGGGAESSTSFTIYSIEETSPECVSLTISSSTIQTGARKTVSVSISENSSVEMLQFAVVYDETKLSLVDSNAGVVMSGKNPTINGNEPGVVYFNWEGMDGISEGGSILELSFAVAEDVMPQTTILSIPTTDPELEFVMMNTVGGEPNELDCVVYNGRITIDSVLFGDVNNDGRINVIDANMIRRYAARLNTLGESQLFAADVNGDGKVNVVDANLIRRYAAKLISEFPAESVS